MRGREKCICPKLPQIMTNSRSSEPAPCVRYVVEISQLVTLTSLVYVWGKNTIKLVANESTNEMWLEQNLFF